MFTDFKLVLLRALTKNLLQKPENRADRMTEMFLVINDVVCNQVPTTLTPEQNTDLIDLCVLQANRSIHATQKAQLDKLLNE